MSPLFFVLSGAMLVVAVAFLMFPFWRDRTAGRARNLGGLLAPLALVPVAIGLYFVVSSYDAERDFLRGNSPADLALLAEMAARLGANPDDAAGWALLGRSYLALEQYELGRQALQEAWNRTPTPDNALRLSYAEALLLTDPSTAASTAGDLIDEVLASEPANQDALWWGGLVAVQRDQAALALERWNALLATNLPPDTADQLRGLIFELTAAAGGSAAPAAGSGAAVPAVAGPVVAVEIAVAPDMPVASLGPNAIVYLLVRAPGGGPPLAAKQIPLAALPGRFEIGVADAVIPGRTIAGQERVTVIARISLTGEPTEQPGDIFGQAEVDVAGGEPVGLTIDSIVPSA